MSGSLIGRFKIFGSPIYVGFLLCVSLLGLSGCNTGPEIVSAPVEGYNHTSANINQFTINGAGGPSIAPFGGGGKQVCCSVLPVKWNPGLRAVIEWETDPNASSKNNLPPLGTDEFRAAYKKYASHYIRHESVVDIPRYAEKVCALQVHFLPCDQVRVSTTCYTPGHQNYPDKAYFQVKESTTCPVL